jgi:molybdopterin-guanine dinucleotide biosynthesis protein A
VQTELKQNMPTMFTQLYPDLASTGCYHFSMRRAGFILTGGHSSRMGQDKALLAWGESTIVEHLAALMTPAVGTVTLVGRPDRYRHLALDCIPGGLEAALARTEAEYNLVVACDHPDLRSEWLIELLSGAERSGSLCTGTRDPSGSIHPLCAVYRRACLLFIQAALNRGERRLLRVIEEFSPVWMESRAVLLNMNTPEEWKAAIAPNLH